MNRLKTFFRKESTETEYTYHSPFNEATGNLCQIRRMPYRFSGYSHPFITVKTIGQITVFPGRLFNLWRLNIINRIRAKRIIGSIIIIFLLVPIWITRFSFRLYPLTSITKTFLIGIIKFFLKCLNLTFSWFAVNTQFRAYPFYKASEWMPHKKLLLNSIVF